MRIGPTNAHIARATDRAGALFADREDAGRVLAAFVDAERDESALVFGLPRGGIPVALPPSTLCPTMKLAVLPLSPMLTEPLLPPINSPTVVPGPPNLRPTIRSLKNALNVPPPARSMRPFRTCKRNQE